ncbi:MAG TPA: cell wall hydrolase [Candidatus Blautia faecipullorum]|nr:cell wall hydrolase [Candidatus Blautia faecipullorum]
MKNKNVSEKRKTIRKIKSTGNPSIHRFLSLSVCALTVLAVSAGCRIADSEKRNEVYAASETETVASTRVEYDLPSGIAGVATGVSSAPEEGASIYRIGTSCEHVMVGQRVQTVGRSAEELNVSESMGAAVDSFDSRAISMASSATMMSDEDYENLLHIVEAEAGTEDIKGRVLVANVIMNRVKHPEFPDTVSEVIWEYDNGVPQFSPVADGRISEVTVSEETKKAVRQALEGTDYSEGALFFIQKSAAEKHNIAWFEKDLTRLFKYGVHEFYTYPDEVSEESKDSETASGEDTQLVQMVKTDTSQRS